MIKHCIIIISLCLALIALGFISGSSFSVKNGSSSNCSNIHQMEGRKGEY